MSDFRGREKKTGWPEDVALRSGLWAVLMALVGLLTAFVVVAIHWNDASGVAALGAVASSIGAILSAYFGIQYTQQRMGGNTGGPGKKRRER